MKTNHRQRADFQASMTEPAALDDAIAWIAANMAPDDVFPLKEIEEVCRDQSDPDDVFPMRELESFIGVRCEPDEIFNYDELGAWALANGYEKENK